jgi:hypothetical protein
MLEVNRRLYLEEPTNNKSTNYEKTKEIISGFFNAIRKYQK